MPICFVLLFKKFQQLVSLFILSVHIQLKFCSFKVLKFDYEKFIDLNRFFVSVIVVMFFVSLEADHLITKKTTDKVFRLNYFVFVPISFVLLFKSLCSWFSYSF